MCIQNLFVLQIKKIEKLLIKKQEEYNNRNLYYPFRCIYKNSTFYSLYQGRVFPLNSLFFRSWQPAF